jgi:hypothetical protein
MERFHYRATSLVHLQAEMRQRELIAAAERPRVARMPERRHRSRLFDLLPFGRRPHR